MISLTCILQASINTHLVSTLKLATRHWMRKTIPNSHWFKLIHYIQLVSSHHPKTGNTMCHIKCWNQSSKKTEMVTMISLTCILQASISIHLVSTHKLATRLLMRKILPIKLWLKSIQFIQLASNLLQKTGNMMCHTKWKNQSSKKIEMVITISLICTLQASINILSVSTHRSRIKRCLNQINPNNHWLRFLLSTQQD